MDEIKIYDNITDDDRRKYAYEKAIEAYWKHVDRYHTWMNYYSLFNGALFVGYCTLLTATTKISLAKESNCEVSGTINNIMNTDIGNNILYLSISNNYTNLSFIICVLGLISSISWLLSLKGHNTWTKNWMNQIQYYEGANVYTVIIASPSELALKSEKKDSIDANPKWFKKKDYYRAISTTKITELFIYTVIFGWLSLMLYPEFDIDYSSCIKDLYSIICIEINPIVFLIICFIIIVFCIHLGTKYFVLLYSDMENKMYYKLKNKSCKKNKH